MKYIRFFDGSNVTLHDSSRKIIDRYQRIKKFILENDKSNYPFLFSRNIYFPTKSLLAEASIWRSSGKVISEVFFRRLQHLVNSLLGREKGPSASMVQALRLGLSGLRFKSWRPHQIHFL